MKTKIYNILISIGVVLFASAAFAGHHEAGENKAKTVIGYDTSEGVRAELYAGSVDTVAIWAKYMKAHDDNDLDAIRAANAEDFKAWPSDGRVLDGTDAQIEVLKDWFASANPRWVHQYSMANEFVAKDGKRQQWVTTGWELTETVDGQVSKSQDVFDVLIENGKIKTIYVATRAILTAE